MSRQKFALYFVSLLALGLLGVWLVFENLRDSTPKFVAGLALMLAAVVGFVTVFRRDVRATEAEKRAEWEKAKAMGRRGFVLRQVLGVVLVLLLFRAAELCVSYFSGRPLADSARSLGDLLWLAPAGAAAVALWALAWWNWQSKKYAGTA